MEFPNRIELTLASAGIRRAQSWPISLYEGITTFVGPNGSGKTQYLREIKRTLGSSISGKKIRFLSSGRLSPLESFRSDYTGQRGNDLNYDDATLGNRSAIQRRHNIETVQGDFAGLSERPDMLIKVQERLKALFNRNLRIDWVDGSLRAYFSRVDYSESEYSSAREASGLLHLVAILSALYDSDVGCVLIDEPEVSLHPQLQSFLYHEMIAVSGDPSEDGKKLIVISTHSTEFIQVRGVKDLARIIFCLDVYSQPMQVDPSSKPFHDRRLKGLLARLGHDHKKTLFCKRPLLVEGISDEIICVGLSRKLNLNIEAGGSHILPVSGKGQMPTVIKLLRLLGKEPVVLADADALVDGLDLTNSFALLDEAKEIASDMGHKGAQAFANTIHSDFSQMVERSWEDIEQHAVHHRYWQHREEGKLLNAKCRAAFCTLIAACEGTVEAWNNGSEWKALRARYLSLLKVLEILGCFVLRKGTIEDYYSYIDGSGKDDKPWRATEEAELLEATEKSVIEETYDDIVEALKFASQTEEISEARAIRDAVLAVVAPALANLCEGRTNEEIVAYCRELLGRKASLFKVESIEEGGSRLLVHLNSPILSVEGFPLSVGVEENPVTAVNRQMKLLPE